MKAYVTASLSLLVVWAVVAFVVGLALDTLFPPPQAGSWFYYVAAAVGLLAGIASFRASMKLGQKSELRKDSGKDTA